MVPSADKHRHYYSCSTLFFGFFCSGEITVPTEEAFDCTKHLAWGDVAIDNTEGPQLLKVHLKKSKSDQLGRGVDVYIGKKGCPLCPVVAITQYMAIRGSKEGPFFQFKDGRPLTKSSFTSKVREALKATGLPEQNFTGHSFRIGAATATASAGIENSVIRTLGRWSSSAYLVYIRTPREHLASFSRTLIQPQY